MEIHVVLLNDSVCYESYCKCSDSDVCAQIEKPGTASTHTQCQTEPTATPLDSNNFKFALRLQQDDDQPHNSELMHQFTMQTNQRVRFLPKCSRNTRRKVSYFVQFRAAD